MSIEIFLKLSVTYHISMVMVLEKALYVAAMKK